MQVQNHNTATPPTTVVDPSTTLRRPKTGRKPLQPINISSTSNSNSIPTTVTLTKPKKQLVDPTLEEIRSNKENNNSKMEYSSLDASLAEELSAMKKRTERLKLDKQRTHNMLKERDSVLEMKMKEMCHRGELQKELEIELDRLYRLKQLKLCCMSVSPLKSLREKQMENKSTETATTLQEAKKEDEIVEYVGDNILGSPSFASSTIDDTSDCVSVNN